MDEFRYNDPEYAPESLRAADHVSMQETDAEQPTIQSGPQCSLFDEHIHNNERKREDLTANEFSQKYELGYHISKFVGKLVRRENRHDRESHGAMNWSAFLQYGGHSFTEEIALIISGWEAARHDFSIARILATLYCVFVARTHWRRYDRI